MIQRTGICWPVKSVEQWSSGPKFRESSGSLTGTIPELTNNFSALSFIAGFQPYELNILDFDFLTVDIYPK